MSQHRVTGKVPRSLLRMLTRELFVAASEAWKGETCVSTVHLSLQPGYYSRCVPDFLYEIKIFTVSLVSSHTESLCAKCVSLRRPSLPLGPSILYSVYRTERLHVSGLLSQVASLNTHCCPPAGRFSCCVWTEVLVVVSNVFGLPVLIVLPLS